MSTIIKASSTSAGADGVPFEFAEIGLDAATRQASEIIARAHTEAAAIRRAAQEQGTAALDAARQATDAQSSTQAAQPTAALRQAVEGIARAKSEWLAHWERSAVQVASAIAARLIRRELSHSPEIAVTLVREALELAGGAGDVQVRMHPDDVRQLGGEIERLSAELSRLGKTRLVADPNVTRGGCRVETRFGAIDQQFEAQLARIEQELL